MSGRRLGWIFGTLAVMLAAWLALRDGGVATPDGLDLGARVDSGVTYVRIDPPGGEPIELERRGVRWTVDGYPAVDSLVAATLARLDTLGPGRLIARRRASHERLGLTDSTAHRVRVGPAGAPQADFLVGRSGTDGRFVRLADADAAYVLPSGVTDPFVADETAWRDFTIARVDTASLRRIVVRRTGEPAIEIARPRTSRDAAAPPGLAAAPPGVAEAPGAASPAGDPDGPRAGTAWRVDGMPADTAVMRLYLDVLAELRATGFPADSFVYAADFEDPVAAVDLYGAGGAVTGPDLSLLFSTGLDHPDALVRRADDPIVYALDRRLANLLTAAAETFRAD